MKEETPPKTAEEILVKRLKWEGSYQNHPLMINSNTIVELMKEYASQIASTPTSKQEGEGPYGEHSMRCNFCQQWFDMRDLDQVFEHEHEGLQKPSEQIGRKVIGNPATQQEGEGWQKCPICEGRGIMSPPYEVDGKGNIQIQCPTCLGKRMIVKPFAATQQEGRSEEAVAFGQWYSGMDKADVEGSYKRWQAKGSIEAEPLYTEFNLGQSPNRLTVNCFDEDSEMSIVIRDNGRKAIYSMDCDEVKELVKYITAHLNNELLNEGVAASIPPNKGKEADLKP